MSHPPSPSSSHPASSSGATRLSHRVSFPGGNGYELAGIVDVAQRPEGSDAVPPVVVFTHCFTCNKDLKAIVRISRLLAASGVTVLRYDMTGLGTSAGDFSWTNFTTNIADVRAAIRFAGHQFGPVTGLIGHSFGGAASLAVAGSETFEEVQSIRALATLAAPADTHHLADLMEWRNPRIVSEGEGEVEIGGRRWQIRREMMADFRSHELSESITRIRVPLMILHSPADETVGFDQAMRIYQLASIRPNTDAPPVSLISLGGADHLLSQNPADLSYVAHLLAAFFHRYR